MIANLHAQIGFLQHAVGAPSSSAESWTISTQYPCKLNSARGTLRKPADIAKNPASRLMKRTSETAYLDQRFKRSLNPNRPEWPN
jgi:hypothetical protein